MSTNPELVAALEGALANFDLKARFDNMLKSLIEVLPQDTFTTRSPNFSRRTHVVSAMLAYDNVLRDLAVEAGIDLTAFDNIIGQVQQLLLTECAKAPPGLKVVRTLQQIVEGRQ